MLRSTLRFIVGAVIAVVIWSYAADAYVAAITPAAELAVRIDARLRHIDTVPNGERVLVRGNQKQPDLPPVLVPAGELTYNVILLCGLFAMTWRRGSLRRFAIALLVLVAVHVLALAVTIESTYATRIPKWSDAHFSPHEQDLWTVLEYSYRLAGMFAIAFALWWWAISDSSASRRSLARSAASRSA